MSSRAKWIAINAVIEPSLLYPLANPFFAGEEMRPIESINSQMQCAALGLNWNFPQALLYGSLQLGGMGTPSPTQKITRERINYFMMSIRHDSVLEKKNSTSFIYTQMETVFFIIFFLYPTPNTIT